MNNIKEIIDKKLNEIVSDERLSYPTANVFENASFALEQLRLQTQRDTLLWVLRIIREQK